MFNSISNNFGAPVISFKDYQEDRYVVLNAHFAYDPTNEDYQRASVLEIKVPDLTLSKSMEAGDIAVYKDSYVYSNKTYLNNFPTVLKSWIKDKNTLCIEKLTNFDEYGPVDIYIFAMYAALNTGEEMTLSTPTSVTLVSRPYAYLDAKAACVVDEHWAFLHIKFDYRISDTHEDKIIMLAGFPEDIVCEDFPLIGRSNQQHYSLGGVNPANIRDGLLTIPYDDRNFGYGSGDDPFIFLYLVRDPHPNVTKYVVLYYHSGRCIDAQTYEEGATIVPPEPPEGYYWNNLPETMPASTVYAQSRQIET